MTAAIARAFFWVILQGGIIGFTCGGWMQGRNINPLIFLVQVLLAVLVVGLNFWSVASKCKEEQAS